MRLGVISDLHGVAGALRAVLDDGELLGVERWWALGDLVMFGPHPVEVLEMLAELADVVFIAGNTTGTCWPTINRTPMRHLKPRRSTSTLSGDTASWPLLPSGHKASSTKLKRSDSSMGLRIARPTGFTTAHDCWKSPYRRRPSGTRHIYRHSGNRVRPAGSIAGKCMWQLQR